MHLDGFLPYRLSRLSEAVSAEIRDVYKGMYGLNRPEWRVLAALAEIGPATAKELGAHSAQHKTKVSRAVASLEQRRWLTRAADPKDRRAEQLAMTAAGRAAYKKLSPPLLEREVAILDRLSPEDRETLLRSLDAFEKAMRLPQRRDLAAATDE